MTKFDLDLKINETAESFCRDIRSKRKRKEVAREYAEHMEDSVARYMLLGKTAEEAFLMTCKDMGSTDSIGELLGKVHNSKNPAYDIDLPEDIRRYVLKNIIKKLVLCGVEITGLVAAWFVCSGYLIGHIGFTNVLALFVALGVLGVSSTGIWRYVTDRPWCGEIIKVTVDRQRNSYSTGAKTGVYMENVIRLYIKKDDGKTIIYNAMRLGENSGYPIQRPKFVGKYVALGDISKHVDNYSEGDRVYHFYGLEHIFVYHFEDMSRVDCIVCGAKNPRSDSQCGFCGHSLVTDEIVD